MGVKSIRLILASTNTSCSTANNSSICNQVKAAFSSIADLAHSNNVDYVLNVAKVGYLKTLSSELTPSRLPTLYFQVDELYVVAEFVGSQISTANIITLMKKFILAYELNEGEYEFGDIKFGKNHSPEAKFPVPLPAGKNGFEFNIPKFAFAFLAAFAGYKSLSSKTKLGQIGFGTAAAYSLYNYSKKE